MIVLRNETTGVIEKCSTGFSWTTCIFGFFVPFFRGDFKWGVIMLVSALISMGLVLAVDIIFAVIYNKIYIKGLVSKGYVANDGASHKWLIENNIIDANSECEFDNSNNEDIGTQSKYNDIQQTTNTVVDIIKEVSNKSPEIAAVFAVLAITSIFTKEYNFVLILSAIVILPIGYIVGNKAFSIKGYKCSNYLDIIGVGLAITLLIGAFAAALSTILLAILLGVCIYKKKEDLQNMLFQDGFGEGFLCVVLTIYTGFSAAMFAVRANSSRGFEQLEILGIFLMLGLILPFFINKNARKAKPFLLFIFSIGLILAKSAIISSIKQNVSGGNNLAGIDSVDVSSNDLAGIDSAEVSSIDMSNADIVSGLSVDNGYDAVASITDVSTMSDSSTLAASDMLNSSSSIGDLVTADNQSVVLNNFFGMDQLSIEPNGAGGYTIFDEAHQYVGTASQGAMGIDLNMADGTSQHITTGGDMLDTMMQYNGHIEHCSDGSTVIRDANQQIINTISSDGTVLDKMNQVVGNIKKHNA